MAYIVLSHINPPHSDSGNNALWVVMLGDLVIVNIDGKWGELAKDPVILQLWRGLGLPSSRYSWNGHKGK